MREEQNMLFERLDIAKVLSVTGCLSSMIFILSIVMRGAPLPL
jgi:hypothetical protein